MDKLPELTVVKIGGNLIDNEIVLASFLKSFSNIPGIKLLVHGGGKMATDLSKKMGLIPKMINGRRITDAETLKIITMVYGGYINKNIVARLQAVKCNAIGLSGADANTVIAVKRPVDTIDYGFAGDVKTVQADIIKKLLDANLTPVFCAITHNTKGLLLNTNADTMAAVIAGAMTRYFKVSLCYCFEKPGVLADIHDHQSVIPIINSENYTTLLDNGIITEGMIPKLYNCFDALKKKVESVKIGGIDMFNANKANTFTIVQL